MNKTNSDIDVLQKFVDDTRRGKYSENICSMKMLHNVRYEYDVIEDVNRTSDVILYGLSY